MSIFDKPITTGQNSTTSNIAGTGGGGGASIFSKPIVTSNQATQAPKITQNAPAPKVTSQPSLIQKVGDFIISQVPKSQIFATAPQDVAPLVQPPQKTIVIAPNQKRLTSQQLKTIAPQPVAGASASLIPKPQRVMGGKVSITPPQIDQSTGMQKVKDFFPTAVAGIEEFKKDTFGIDKLVKRIDETKNTSIGSIVLSDMAKKSFEVLYSAFDAINTEAKRNYDSAKQIQKTGVVPKDYQSQNLAGGLRQVKNLAGVGFLPGSIPFAAAEEIPIISAGVKAVGIALAGLGDVGKSLTIPVLDKMGIKGELRDSILGIAELTTQIIGATAIHKVTNASAQKIKSIGTDTFIKLTKDIAETTGQKMTVTFSPQDVLDVRNTAGGPKYQQELIKIISDTAELKKNEGVTAGGIWADIIKGKKGATIELPYETVVSMMDKPWWNTVKKAFRQDSKAQVTSKQIPGRLVDGPPVANQAVPKTIVGLLPENTSHTPQQVIGAVMKGGLENTPEGKGLLKAAAEAQRAGTDLVLEKAQPKPQVPQGRDITLQDRVIMEQIKTLEPIAKADMQKAQAEADVRSAATQDLGLQPKDRRDFARLGALIKNASDKGMIDVSSLKKTSSTLLNWGLERWREIKPQAAQMTDDEILLEIQDFTLQNSMAKQSKVEKPASVTLLEELKRSVKDVAKENQKEILRTLDQAYQEAGVDPQTGKVDKSADALAYIQKKAGGAIKFRTSEQGIQEAQAYTDHARMLIERRKNLKQEHPEWLDTNDILAQNEKAINVALDLAAKARSSAPKYRVKDDVKSFTGKTITDAQEQEIIDLNKKIFGDDKVKITLQIMANEKALGQYRDGMIQVLDGQADPTATFMHEAVHKYLDIFSTKEEYIGALVEGSKKYKLDDFAQVEEKIAEDFINFAKDQSTFRGKIKAFFSDILRRIKSYFGNKSEIDKLYNDIIAGKAATAAEVKTGATTETSKIPTNTDAQTPVGTGELKKSKAYTRVFDLLKEEFQQDVSYNVLNLEKDAKNAVDYIAKNPKSAIRIGLGLEQPPEGQTETAISIALAEKAATEGDYALQSRLESSRSLRQTRRGQEIVSERGRFESDSPHKYMRELLNKRLANLGANVKDALADVVNKGRSMKQAAMEKIDTEAKKIKEAIKKDRKKIQMAQDIINSLICT